MPPQIAPARIGRDEADEDVQRTRRPLEVRADPERRDEPDPELALTADVEEPAAEGERHREAVRMSGVVTSSVCWRSRAASSRASPVTQGKNQFRPVPSKIAR